jgi:hypothetical protein
MVFQPGQSGNPTGNNGHSTRRKGNAEIFHEIKDRGYLDPLLTLAKIQHESATEGIRASAAASLAAYCHPKLQSLPVPRFITTPFEVPEFVTVADAERFLARIPVLVARGELDIDLGKELSAMTSAWISARTASEFEERLTIVEQSMHLLPQNGTTAVIGGLPRLPVGPDEPDVIMPGSNGHQLPAPDDKPQSTATNQNPPHEP